MTTTVDTKTTTSRSDFVWPCLAQGQQIFDWDRHEFKAQRSECMAPQSPQWFRSAETLELMPYSRRLPFDFELYPKPILAISQRPRNFDNASGHHPSEVRARCLGRIHTYEFKSFISTFVLQRLRGKTFFLHLIRTALFPVNFLDFE